MLITLPILAACMFGGVQQNRYASQADLLAAAHGFANRSVPVDVIVIDWMHWKVRHATSNMLVQQVIQ